MVDTPLQCIAHIVGLLFVCLWNCLLQNLPLLLRLATAFAFGGMGGVFLFCVSAISQGYSEIGWPPQPACRNCMAENIRTLPREARQLLPKVGKDGRGSRANKMDSDFCFALCICILLFPPGSKCGSFYDSLYFFFGTALIMLVLLVGPGFR